MANISNIMKRDMYSWMDSSNGGLTRDIDNRIAHRDNVAVSDTITKDNIDYSDYDEKFDIKLSEQHVKLMDDYINQLETFYKELDDDTNFNINVETKMLESILKDVSSKK